MLPLMIISALSFASSIAMYWPMPLLAPVTNTILFSKIPGKFIHLLKYYLEYLE